MGKIIVTIIHGYQKLFSPEQGILPRIFGRSRATCPFYPSCSEYAKQSFEKYGFFKATRLSFWRILRCHPWQKPRTDKP